MSLVHGADANHVMVPLLLGPSGEVLLYGSDGTGTARAVLTDTTGSPIIAGEDAAATPRKVLTATNGALVAAGLDAGSVARTLLTDTDGAQVVENRVYDGAAWQKAKGDATGRTIIDAVSPSLMRPLRRSTSLVNLTLPVGSSTQTVATVPAGETWRITDFIMAYVGTITNVQLLAFVIAGGVSLVFNSIKPPVSGTYYDKLINVVLTAGDTIGAVINGATLNDNFVGNVFAERIY